MLINGVQRISDYPPVVDREVIAACTALVMPYASPYTIRRSNKAQKERYSRPDSPFSFLHLLIIFVRLSPYCRPHNAHHHHIKVEPYSREHPSNSPSEPWFTDEAILRCRPNSGLYIAFACQDFYLHTYSTTQPYHRCGCMP